MAVDSDEQLAEQMQRVLLARGWSLRRAARQTGIKYSTIYNMSLGVRVGPQFVVRWAAAIGERRRDWLMWAGYGEFIDGGDSAPMPEGARESHTPIYDAVMGTATKLHSLPPQKYRLIADLIDELSGGRDADGAS